MKPNKLIIETFEKLVSEAFTTNKNLFLYPNITETVIEKVKEIFFIDKDEVILCFYDDSFINKYNEGLVFTDRRIAVKKKIHLDLILMSLFLQQILIILAVWE